MIGKLLAITLLCFVVSTLLSVLRAFFKFLENHGVSENRMWTVALAIVIALIPFIVKVGDFLEVLWNYD